MQTSIKLGVVFVIATIPALAGQGAPPAASPAGNQPPPVQLTAEQDRQRMMDLLHITSLRPGADNHDPNSPNAVNYDESKANPFPNLAGPAGLEQREEGDHGKDVVETAPPGDRGVSRSRHLWTCAQQSLRGEVGSDQRNQGGRRRCTSGHRRNS